MTFLVTAELVKGIWEDVLGVDVDKETDFFETSGDSLSAMRIYARVGEALDISLPLVSLFDNPRFGDFLEVVANEVEAKSRNSG